MSFDDEAAVRKVIDAYGDRLRAGDVPGILDLYTEDAAVMQPGLDITVGKEELRAAYEGAFAAMGLDFTFQIGGTLIGGDLAAARTTGTGTITVRATGETQPARFRELFVLRRTGGGRRIAQYMFQQLPGQP